MERYFQLRDDMTVADRWHLGEVLNPQGEEPLLDVAERYTGSTPLTADLTHQGRSFDFTLTCFAVPVVSQRMARLFSTLADENAQLIPLRIDERMGWMALNVLRSLNCLDEAASEFVRWKGEDGRPELVGKYRQVSKLRLNRDKIPANTPLFRVTDWEVALIVSERLKTAIETVGGVGAHFSEV